MPLRIRRPGISKAWVRRSGPTCALAASQRAFRLSAPKSVSTSAGRRLGTAPPPDDAGIPRCDCGAPLKPDVVLFGELLPARAIQRAQCLCAGADLLLCIGSSLEVHPVADLPRLTLAAGGRLAIVTAGPTPYDAAAAVRMGGDVVAELAAVLAAL